MCYLPYSRRSAVPRLSEVRDADPVRLSRCLIRACVSQQKVLDAGSKRRKFPSCCPRLRSRLDLKVSKLCEEYMRIYNFCGQWYGRHVNHAVLGGDPLL